MSKSDFQGWDNVLPSQASQDALVATACPDCGNEWEAPPPGADWAHNFCPKCRFPLELVAGKYRLIRRLGSGAFGDVYLAEHLKLAQAPTRVVKVLKSDMFQKPEARLRFQREIQLTSVLSLQNEHIVHIFDDFGEDPKLGYFYVMEYLDGRPLQALLAQDNLPTLALCQHIMSQLCDGIAAAHRENIIHRDLKPDNIFLVERHEDPHFVKILDFGIAKPLRQGSQDIAGPLTGRNRVLGTPHYMSPEQCIQGEINARSDIYAMGIILYELLVGHPPFAHQEAGGLPNLLRAHMQESPPRPLLRQPERGIPQALEDVVLKALAKQPSERFDSAQAFKVALEAACAPVHGELAWRHYPTDPYAQVPIRETATPDGPTPPVESPASMPPPGVPEARLEARAQASLDAVPASLSPMNHPPIDPVVTSPSSTKDEAPTTPETPAWQPPPQRRKSRVVLLLGFGLVCGVLGTWAWLSVTVWPWWDATSIPHERSAPLRMGDIPRRQPLPPRRRPQQVPDQPAPRSLAKTNPPVRKTTPDQPHRETKTPSRAAPRTVSKRAPIVSPRSRTLRRAPARRRTWHISWSWKRKSGLRFKVRSAPKQRRRAVVRRRPPARPRPLKQRRALPRPPTRPKHTTPKGCPPRPGTRWIRVSVSPKTALYTLRFVGKTPPTLRRRGWFCLAFVGTSQHTLRILSDGYRPCRLTLTAKRPLIQLVLRGDDPNSFEEEKHDYCRKP